MLRALRARLRQGHRTISFPKGDAILPDRFRGVPTIDASICPEGCSACVDACPTAAILRRGDALRIDLGRCLFCPDCAVACPRGAITHSREFRMAARGRDDLVTGDHGSWDPPALADAGIRRLFHRSLKLRQVSAGGCNACEADANVLTTIVFDLSRFGIQFVASPRHADGLLVTGPVTDNMRLALEKTWKAVPSPKIVIAAGACAVSGGPFAGHPEVSAGLDSIMPVDLYVPGCPPHPLTLLDGLLRLLGE